ncbi:ComEC/Rec2 family competence protein [Propionicimonas sp.]|uniref:ComEC/Rec2 family competence protein n=1 Tax=Propionicimonas sp. TaxID=1955623 RepID=UPI001DC6F191|nr:ComEC/Rec2 family competence protein [Propionicimonas sp.]MBU3976011.1 ComEC/Rec2 family competence protein [Actinomycetota bacterium]MBU3985201.1 ComEC/Rec2 family competence protein [Actinomycetota bacterium]MBU4008191.1 ComEC/Rec2 family competence protein [Actinomycetota bacterium]MBU4064595.1 ComEC/Rec2 family competence protein [Actinomycetota bacterium]MBU4094107.1 ComEC/Rec2 family competence protein [Actinomycetota bacterium]
MVPRPTPTLPTASASEPLDARPVVLAVAVWLGGWLGTGGQSSWSGLGLPGPAGWPWLGAAAVAAAVALSWRLRSRLLLAVALALGLSLGLAGARVWAADHGALAELAADGAVVRIEARLAEGHLAVGGPGGPVWLVALRLTSVDGRGQAWLVGDTVQLSASGGQIGSWQGLPPGTAVSGLVKLSPAEDASFSAWASARAAPAVTASPGPLDAGVNAVRAGLRQSVAGLPAEPAALVPALVVGDTEGFPVELSEQFRTTGLTHLTAVSGANLTLLLAAVLLLAARVGVLGWWRRGLAVLVVAGFVVLCRAEPSVLRAAAMGLVGLAALGWSGPRQGLRYLSWAIIALVLIDPWLARSVGFALSVLASAGIVFWARRWTQVLAGWMPGWLAEAITVPVAAQLATQPLVTAISGQVSVVGLVANLVAAPLVGPGTVLGFAAAWASVVVAPVAVGLGWAAGGFAQGLCWIAAAGSALPGASASWPVSAVGIVVLLTACVVIAIGLPMLFARPWLVGVVGLALVVTALRPLSPPGWPPAGWLVVSCDVGQGDATVIRAGPTAAIVVDAGPQPKLVDRCLDQLGITEVPWLVFTHPHADHFGGVAGVFTGRQVARVLLPAVNTAAAGWQQVRAAAGGVPVVWAAPGLVVSAGTARLSVLALQQFVAPSVLAAESAEENDSSVVLRAEIGGVRLLLAGDLQESGQSAAVAAAPDLKAEVLLVPHHGSAHQSPAFLAAVGAKLALISVGADNSYGHPAARTLTAVQGTGAQLYRTDQSGAIGLTQGRAGLIVTTQRSG